MTTKAEVGRILTLATGLQAAVLLPWHPKLQKTCTMNTLLETNIAPENGWLEDEISYWEGLFSGGGVTGDPVKFST